jgi:hypothetical protein
VDLDSGDWVARHNREGTGCDQHGFEYEVSYQPDSLRHVKISRALESGRQSTMTLFRNPADHRDEFPGELVRTRITCPKQGVDLEVTVRGDQDGVRRVSLTCDVAAANGKGTEEVTFTFENGLPPAPRKAARPRRR